MIDFSEFINLSANYIGVFILMFSSFLIGYIAAWFFQKNKYDSLVSKVKRQANINKINSNKVNDIEAIFTELKPKIVAVVKETQHKNKQGTSPEIIDPEKRKEAVIINRQSSYVNYVKSKPKLNFENFGYGSKDAKDDLTLINGIGPYIEERLNEIGIYNYNQISNFTAQDIRSITELIDFFPGRIESDNWIGQAQNLKQYH